MKKIFTLIAMCLASLSVMSQSSLVATLTHEGTTTEYYGVDGFSQALSACDDGDLITLSGGIFHGGNITKDIILRGNGMDGDNKTIIDSEVKVWKTSEEVDDQLLIEGIWFNTSFVLPNEGTGNVSMIAKKCLFSGDINLLQKGPKNTSFINCINNYRISIGAGSEVSFLNSIITGPTFSGVPTSVNFLNCFLICGFPGDIPPCTITNSIVTVSVPSGNAYHAYFKSDAIFNNSVIGGFSNYGDPTGSCTMNNSTWGINILEMFNDSTNPYGYDPNSDYTLTNEAKTTYIGTDGTEIGIYGGAAPYSSVVTYPHFTTFNVAEKSVDGKISVEIAVE